MSCFFKWINIFAATWAPNYKIKIYFILNEKKIIRLRIQCKKKVALSERISFPQVTNDISKLSNLFHRQGV